MVWLRTLMSLSSPLYNIKCLPDDPHKTLRPDFLSWTRCNMLDCCGVLWHPTKIEAMWIFSEGSRSSQPGRNRSRIQWILGVRLLNWSRAGLSCNSIISLETSKWVFVWMDQVTVWERRAVRLWGRWWRKWIKQTCWDHSGNWIWGAWRCPLLLRMVTLFVIQGLHFKTVDISTVMMKENLRTRRTFVKTITMMKQIIVMDTMMMLLWGKMDE